MIVANHCAGNDGHAATDPLQAKCEVGVLPGGAPKALIEAAERLERRPSDADGCGHHPLHLAIDDLVTHESFGVHEPGDDARAAERENLGASGVDLVEREYEGLQSARFHDTVVVDED